MKILSNLRQHPRLFNWLNRLHLVKAFSQTHPNERACLCRHVAQSKHAVEIGTFMGLTAAEMARTLPDNATLYCVDPYPGRGEPLKQIALRQIRRAGVSHKVRMINSDSTRAVAILPIHVDFFFVDGDHSFEGLAADWKVVKQLLRPGGLAAFHDTARSPLAIIHSEEAIKFFEGTIACDPDFEMVEQVLSLNVIRRKS